MATASAVTASASTGGSRVIPATFWLCLLVLFVALRFDNSERTYFQIDDQVVVWLVDDAVNKGLWQPDWYRASHNVKHTADYFARESTRTDLPHDHHYNFSAHILLSAAMIKPLRMLDSQTPTIVLLHHIALLWDALSLLLLVAAARSLGGNTLAACSAVLYTVFPLAVQGSHYARPDALLTAMGSAVLWLSLARAQQTKSQGTRWPWLLATGTALGVAIGGKASQLMLGIFPALACSAVLLDRTQWHWRNLLRIAGDGAALLLVIAATLVLMFTAGDMHPRDFWLSLLSIQNYYRFPGPPDTLEQYNYLAQLLNSLQYFYATLGWPLLLAMLVGIASLARRTDKLPLLLLTVPLLLFTLYFASLPAFFDRSFCPLAAAIVLLAASGIHATATHFSTLPAKPVLAVVLATLACWQPLIIQYHLQTDHLREFRNRDRLAFQQQLKSDFSAKTATDFWLKNIDRGELYGQTLPDRPPQNPRGHVPRIYVMEDLNDWNSRQYRQKLLDHGFVQIAEFRGDFADMPTNSLITVHEAARFYYFVRADELPQKQP